MNTSTPAIVLFPGCCQIPVASNDHFRVTVTSNPHHTVSSTRDEHVQDSPSMAQDQDSVMAGHAITIFRSSHLQVQTQWIPPPHCPQHQSLLYDWSSVGGPPSEECGEPCSQEAPSGSLRAPSAACGSCCYPCSTPLGVSLQRRGKGGEGRRLQLVDQHHELTMLISTDTRCIKLG